MILDTDFLKKMGSWAILISIFSWMGYSWLNSRGPSDEQSYYYDLDCSDFASRKTAQLFYDQQDGDPHNLDRDRDGIVCENL